MKTALALALLMMGSVVVAFAPMARADDPAPARTLYVSSGIIRSIDLEARTILVEESASMSRRFVVPTDTEIILKDKPRGELRELILGDKVQVKYTDDDGQLVAHQIANIGLKAGS